MNNDRERDAQLNIQIYQTQQFELQQFVACPKYGAGMCTGYRVLVWVPGIEKHTSPVRPQFTLDIE
jgi:hypothetical protein